MNEENSFKISLLQLKQQSDYIFFQIKDLIEWMKDSCKNGLEKVSFREN